MIKNTIKTTFLLATMAGLFIGIGLLFGGHTGMIIGFVIAMVLNFGSFWFSDKIVLKMHNAKEVKSGHFHDLVKDLAQRAKLPIPKTYIINSDSPNAFATGRSPSNAAVACSKSLINILSEEELKGVMAHELSHVKHRDTLIQTIAVAFASAIAIIAEMIQWAAIFGLGGNDEEESGVGSWVGMIAIMILAPLIATIIQLAISRQREFLADEGAAKLIKSGIPLATALTKLESASVGVKSGAMKNSVSSLYIINPFRSSMIGALFSTHPSTEERIKRLKNLKHFN